MTQWLTAADAFFNAGAILFPIMNPIGCALLLPRMTPGLTPDDRRGLARRIARNAGMALLVAIFAGAPLLKFFGISLSAVRIAGGLVVAAHAWRMLADAKSDIRSFDTAAAFVPFTIPFTTGPGTLAAAMSLGSLRPVTWTDAFAYFLGFPPPRWHWPLRWPSSTAQPTVSPRGSGRRERNWWRNSQPSRCCASASRSSCGVRARLGCEGLTHPFGGHLDKHKIGLRLARDFQ